VQRQLHGVAQREPQRGKTQVCSLTELS